MAKKMIKRADGSYRIYYELRANVWRRGAVRQFYAGYLGRKPVITETRARELAAKITEKLGRRVTVEDLRKVKRLRIVADEPSAKSVRHEPLS